MAFLRDLSVFQTKSRKTHVRFEMFVRLLSDNPNYYPDGDGGSFLGMDARLGVNLLPHLDIRQTLRIQGSISPLTNMFSWDGTYVRIATVTQQIKTNQNYPHKKYWSR